MGHVQAAPAAWTGPRLPPPPGRPHAKAVLGGRGALSSHVLSLGPPRGTGRTITRLLKMRQWRPREAEGSACGPSCGPDLSSSRAACPAACGPVEGTGAQDLHGDQPTGGRDVHQIGRQLSPPGPCPSCRCGERVTRAPCPFVQQCSLAVFPFASANPRLQCSFTGQSAFPCLQRHALRDHYHREFGSLSVLSI